MRCRECGCVNEDETIEWTDDKIEKFTIELNPKYFCTKDYDAICTYDEFLRVIAALRESENDFRCFFIDSAYEAFVSYMNYKGIK